MGHHECANAAAGLKKSVLQGHADTQSAASRYKRITSKAGRQIRSLNQEPNKDTQEDLSPQEQTETEEE